MIKNIIFDMGNVLLKFDRNYFLDAVGVKPADRRTFMNNVYLSLEWAKMDRGSMTEEEAAASMCSRLPERLHEHTTPKLLIITVIKSASSPRKTVRFFPFSHSTGASLTNCCSVSSFVFPLIFYESLSMTFWCLLHAIIYLCLLPPRINLLLFIINNK